MVEAERPHLPFSLKCEIKNSLGRLLNRKQKENRSAFSCKSGLYNPRKVPISQLYKFLKSKQKQFHGLGDNSAPF